MKSKIIETIRNFNMDIIESRKRYLRKEKINEALKFHGEIDLERYIDSINYEKVEAIKAYLKDNIDINIEDLSIDDKKMVEKILFLIKTLPKYMHKCIGCPCLENDYPKCDLCSFKASCLSGNAPYPDNCVENDCFTTFKYLENLADNTSLK